MLGLFVPVGNAKLLFITHHLDTSRFSDVTRNFLIYVVIYHSSYSIGVSGGVNNVVDKVVEGRNYQTFGYECFGFVKYFMKYGRRRKVSISYLIKLSI